MQLFDTRGLDPFLADFDRLAQRVLGASATPRAAAPVSGIPFDVVRRGDALVLEFDMPGADWSDLDVRVEGRAVTVSAKRQPVEPEGSVVYARGRFTGEFRQQITFPDGLDLEALEASWEHGVLALRVPVLASAQPRRVEVRGVPQPPADQRSIAG
ncbi:HSP20 family protein [Motilibacter rhizosphaerae]|uniref:HSP20 family protein n=1 Tax=Motilibacter rhizosphaerae TaxID=598652 RepID=A0A4Q7NX03_9ACTN|nr:Hsp20/alpha crystallin family protein [Motilibacter rhizosphaerae]RZS90932.1 HSP20 family protein [Motilibacter rhizosphaerae]